MNIILIWRTRIHFNIMILMLMGQLLNSKVVVTLQELTSSWTTKRCYDVSLNMKATKDFFLTGQNYCPYYDIDGVLFDEKSITFRLLSPYTILDLVKHHFDVDRSGFGVLNYDNHLGFINLDSDYFFTTQKVQFSFQSDFIV
jgi:hypothetical protein